MNEQKVLKVLMKIPLSDKNPGIPDHVFFESAKETGLSVEDLWNILSSLNQQGLIKITKKKDISYLFVTKGGQKYLKDFQEREREKLKNKIVFWATVIGTLLAVIAILISFRDIIWLAVTSPKDYLTIQKVEIVPSSNLTIGVVSGKDPTTYNEDKKDDLSFHCLSDSSSNCAVHILLNTEKTIPSIHLDVVSKFPSLSIGGLNLTLKDFKEIPQDPINYIQVVQCGGIGGGGVNYEINSFPKVESSYLPITLETITDKSDPQKWIGDGVEAKVVCTGTGCDQGNFVTNTDPINLNLEMPFLKEIPPGWYEFDLGVIYFYENQKITSSARFTFDVIKPYKVRPWWKVCEDSPFPSFATVDLMSKSVKPLVNFPQLPNNQGLLIFNSIAADDEGFYKVDLKSGIVEHVGLLDMLPYKLGSSSVNSTGLLWAFETIRQTISEKFDTNIGFLDLERDLPNVRLFLKKRSIGRKPNRIVVPQPYSKTEVSNGSRRFYHCGFSGGL